MEIEKPDSSLISYQEIYAVEPPDELRCPICLDVFRYPVITRPCSHTFCRTCLVKCAAACGVCPSCRQRVSMSDVAPNIIVAQLIDSLQLHCAYSKRAAVLREQSETEKSKSSLETPTKSNSLANVSPIITTVNKSPSMIEENTLGAGKKSVSGKVTELQSPMISASPVHSVAFGESHESLRYCPLILRRDQMEAHIHSCEYAPMICPLSAYGCPWTGSKREFSVVHERQCLFSQVQPLLSAYSHRVDELSNELAFQRRIVENLEGKLTFVSELVSLLLESTGNRGNKKSSSDVIQSIQQLLTSPSLTLKSGGTKETSNFKESNFEGSSMKNSLSPFLPGGVASELLSAFPMVTSPITSGNDIESNRLVEDSRFSKGHMDTLDKNSKSEMLTRDPPSVDSSNRSADSWSEYHLQSRRRENQLRMESFCTATFSKSTMVLDRVLSSGHTDTVESLVTLRDAILSGSWDSTVKVWDPVRMTCLRTMQTRGDVRSLAADLTCGELAYSGSSEGMLQLWDIETGESLSDLEAHPNAEVLDICIGSRILATSGSDNVIRLWPLQGRRIVSTQETIPANCLRGHTDWVFALHMDESRLYSGSSDRSVRVWNLDRGNCEHTLLAHTDQVRSIEPASPNTLLSGSYDCTVRCWDLRTMSAVSMFPTFSDVYGLAVYDHYVACGSESGAVYIFDLRSRQPLHTLRGHSGTVYCFAQSADRLWSGSSDMNIHLWSGR